MPEEKKKRTRRKSVSKKRIEKYLENSIKSNEILQQKIIENMVELQKVQVNVTSKFENLSKQISSLLELFENAAKTYVLNPENQVIDKDKDFLEKINLLMDQNKTIARGLTLMEERIRERIYGEDISESHLATNKKNTSSTSNMLRNTPTSPKMIPPQEAKNKSFSEEKEDYEVSELSRPLPRF